MAFDANLFIIVSTCRKVRALNPEDMQPNPIYDATSDASEQQKKDGSSSPEQSASYSDNPRYASTDDLLSTPGKSVADNPQYSTNTGTAYYEMIDEIPARKKEETFHIQGDKGNNQIYYNVVGKRDDPVIYCNAKQ